jgi:hypothetical protein
MLDLETLSTEVHLHPVVLSIGIATDFGFSFYAELPTAAQVGRHRHLPTVQWWRQQADDLPARCARLDRRLIGNKLRAAALILGKADLVWAKGPQFDVSIIESLFYQHRITPPYKYNSVRDYRTIVGFSGPVTHNAYEDAFAQLNHLKEYLHDFK